MSTDPKIPHAARILQRPAARRAWIGTRLGLLTSWCLLACLGCQQITEHFNRVRPNNPVVGPAPPRISLDEESTAGEASIPQTASLENRSETGEIVPISMTSPADAEPIDGAAVVAMVNGNQILASDIFAPYEGQMEKMKSQLPPEQFAMAQLELLKRDLPDHIERTMLSHATRTSLKQEQADKIEGVLDKAFEDHVKTLLEKTDSSTTLELRRKLQEQGTSLESLRETFGQQQLAMQYLMTHSEVDPEIGRKELLEYYNEHKADFSHEARAKWQELRISFAEHGGRQEALEVLNKAVADLQNGKTFGEVAKEYSDGPTASVNGEWDWTTEGSLANETINKEIFSLPVQGISKILESDDKFQVVKVTAREEAHLTPFEDVQMDLRRQIRKDLQDVKMEEVLTRLRESAVIETIFDNDPALAKQMRAGGKFSSAGK